MFTNPASAQLRGLPEKDRVAAVADFPRCYRTSSPVTARPISIRWISDVPSTRVKSLATGEGFAGRRPVDPVVSVRIQRTLSEMDGFPEPVPGRGFRPHGQPDHRDLAR